MNHETTSLSPSVEKLMEEDTEWKKEGFDLQSTLDNLRGAFIEVAGPTWGDYDMLTDIDLPKRIIGSNLHPHSTNNLPLAPEFLADATNLPVANETVGALFASNMAAMAGKDQPDLWEGFIRESLRVLEPGGLLVVQSMPEEAVYLAENVGLEPVYAHYEKAESNDQVGEDLGVDSNGNEIVWAQVGGVEDFIFQKAKKPNENPQ